VGEQGTIVTRQNEGDVLWEARNPVLQPSARRDVEAVARLIEDHHVTRACQRNGERGAVPQGRVDLRDGRVECNGRKDTPHGTLDLQASAVAPCFFERLVRLRNLRQGDRPGCESTLHVADVRLGGVEALHRRVDQIGERAAGRCHLPLLRNEGHVEARKDPTRPLGRVTPAAQHVEQRRLAAPVTAHERPAIPSTNLPRGRMHEDVLPEQHVHVAQVNEAIHPARIRSVGTLRAQPAYPAGMNRAPSLPIPPERHVVTRDVPMRSDARYVLYWMQQAQRSHDNPALDVAIHHAHVLGLPVLVTFGLDDTYPGANARHMAYLLDGLADVADGLQERGIGFAARYGSPPDVAIALARDAAVLVCDRGYLRHQRAWRRTVARGAPCRVEEVEGETVVPVEVASDKREWAARTIRPKIWREAERFLTVSEPVQPSVSSIDLDSGDGLPRVVVHDKLGTLAQLHVDRSVAPVASFPGGERHARASYRRFLEARFGAYVAHRNQPQTDDVSHLSKALHFGHVSVVRAVLDARAAAPNDEARDAFLEELIIRRELAINFTWFAEDDYDRYETLPDWARTTLDEHRHDVREYLYDAEQLANAETHDPYWNAAMREMVVTGYMHNYMRMYWGKKILEWSATPEEGFATTIALNDRYFLDGRDPNSYTGVGWCYGLHDRAWTERPVFGKIRYMNAAGLKRKADPDAYVVKVARLEAEENRASSR